MASLLAQFLITLQRGPELFAPRILVLPGILGAVTAGIWLARLPTLAAAALIALQGVVGGIHLSRYTPEYDRKMAAIGEAFSRSPAWRSLSHADTLGSDLPTWKLPVVALLSGRPRAFRPIHFDPESGRVALPFPDPPRSFLIGSEEIRRILVRNLGESFSVDLGEVTLLTTERALALDLQPRR
jgi:hypothetical protein